MRLAYEAMQNLDKPLVETGLKEIFEKHVRELVPLKVSDEMAFEYIKNADRCAVGERLCKCEFPDAPSSCAVFLEDLADAMVEVGKAIYTSKKEAMEALTKHKGKPLMVSKISGKYLEICRTWPKKCFYWNMEKHGMKCIQRHSKPEKENI
ncbi:MAG: hypothetical protein KJO26_00145 [Deltaproteobacteria bacterium]|nr:hypothetical protein [Deltaproteobacteria bacterium]